MRKQVLSLIEVLVIIVIVLLLLALVMPQLGRVKPISQRIVCGTNLKSLGQAMSVYADDYDGNYPQLPGEGPWSKELGFDYFMTKPDFTAGGAQEKTPRCITASWYLLVREADVSPKSFHCSMSPTTFYEGVNPANKDITELWDFGPEPYKHVSYAMQNPYGKYPAHTGLPEGFAVAADMSPWFKDGDILEPGEGDAAPQIISIALVKRWREWRVANSQNHAPKRKRYHGQNVLYGDGHMQYQSQPNVGINKDNIYTYWSTDENPSEQVIQGGKNPMARDEANDAKSKDDSFLAL